MLDQDTINQQLALLAAHRRTLDHLLQQAAQFGGEVFAPPQTANGIAEARAAIQRIKAVLRKNDVQVEDDPNDKAPRRRKPVQLQQAGDVISGDKVAGDKVGGDKVMGDKHVHLVQPTLSPALHQLRAPVADFVGREQEIDQLVQTLNKAASGGAAAAISGVRGMGGIGKTELAYVVANRLKDSFPDAQIVVELRGASSPMTPEATLQQVIHSFDPKAVLPGDLSQLQARYRSVLTGKRVLIVTDDARDVRQVHPLLPPSGCALVVTTRNRFSLPGMQTVDLEVLSPTEAEQLLLEIYPHIGEHTRELAKLCGYLPLALRVSAELLKENDNWDVDRYIQQLRVERLKHLADPDNQDDPQASVEASLRLSYKALNPEAQSTLCQLCVFSASFSREAAQAVIAIDGDVDEVLGLLRRRSLLDWKGGVNRPYSLHDLVRIFGNGIQDKQVVIQESQQRLHLYATHVREKLAQLWDHIESVDQQLQYTTGARRVFLERHFVELVEEFRDVRDELGTFKTQLSSPPVASQSQHLADTPDEG